MREDSAEGGRQFDQSLREVYSSACRFGKSPRRSLGSPLFCLPRLPNWHPQKRLFGTQGRTAAETSPANVFWHSFPAHVKI